MKHLPLYPIPPLPPIQGALLLTQNTACSLCRLAEGNPVGQRCLPADGRPGDILVVSDYPGEVERRLQRPMAGPAGRWLRDLFKRVAPERNVVYTNAINCHPASGVTPDTLEAAALSCRGYVAKVLEECQPKLVLLMGPYAGRSFLGRSYAPLSVRTGYSWCFDVVNGEFRGVPVFFMPNPAAAVRNPLIARAFEKDLLANLAAAPDLQPHHTTAAYSIVETPEDAATALEMLSKAAYVATDVEASGVMFEDDYRIECLSVSNGEYTFVWGRDTLCNEALAPYLDRILTELDHTSWNGQYDYCAIECEPAIDARHDKPPHHPGGKLNLQSDARLKRKLYEADAAGDLATAAELVGMGGHKEENEAIVTEVCHELSKLALSTTLTPTGKVRKAPALRWVRQEEVHPRWIEKLLQGFTPKMFAHRFVPEDVEWRYNARDAYTTWHLEAWANDRLLRFAEEEDDGLLRVWSDVTQPAMWAYCRMRINGFPIHKEYLQVFQTYLETAIAEVQKKIDAYCPGLNSESPKQVGAYLSSVGVRPSRKTESGQPSYSDDALEDYADKHPMVDLILQHRELVKQLGTYAVGLAHYVCSDGRAHPTVLQDGTDTGRSSCKEPNLFNQSKGRTARKRVLANMLRAAFVAPSGWSFIDADEGQIEIRGAAHLSGDPAMKEMLASGTDFHQQSAEKFAVAQGKDPTKVTELDREIAKTSNFAAVYEIPSELGFMLSSRLKLPRKAGEALGDAMFRTYKGLLAFMEDRYSAAWQKGYTRTHWKGQPGRRRPLWGLGSNPPTLAELQAAIAQEKQNRGGTSRLDKNAARSTYNTDVQGSSVDVVASMLWRMQRWLDENTDGGQFVLHVYDSIVLLVQDKDIDKTVKFLVALMRDDAGTERYMGDIALRVDVKVGRCLGAVEKIKGV